ncbi:MAG: Hpt domain-containing protein [Pseudobacteriovorax sp.]|nr:Hpt domain-containing protein [Pseudobacteriovorax sp.]
MTYHRSIPNSYAVLCVLSMFYFMIPISLIGQSTPQTATVVFGDGRITITEDQFESSLIGKGVEYVSDPSFSLTIDDILEKDRSLDWQLSHQTAFSLGFTPDQIWLRYRVYDQRSTPKPLKLETAFPNVDFIELYDVTENGIRTFYAGDHDYERWPMESRLPTFPLEAQKERTLYIKTWGGTAIQLPMTLVADKVYAKRTRSADFLQLLFLGATAAIFIYNALLFFGTGISVYFHYVIFLFANALFQATQSGLGMFLFWPGQATLHEFFIISSMGVGAISSTKFTISLLSMDREKKIVRYFPGFLITGTLLGCLCFLFEGLALAANFTIIGVVFPWLLFVVYCGIDGWKRGLRVVKWYTAAWVFYVAGTMTTALRFTSVVPVNLFTMNAQQIGSLIEYILLSLALADRIKVLSENLAVKNKQLESASAKLKVMNENLEDLVKEKTREVDVLLDYVPQGIFLVKSDLKIYNQYSRHLEDILGRENIAGQDFEELCLNHWKLSENEKDTIRETLKSVLDEHEINFEANFHNLPLEIDNGFSEEDPQSLRLTWNVVTDELQRTEMLLVTLLDVTQEKQTEEKLAKQKQETTLITELVSCGQDSFKRFFDGSQELLNEMKAIIEHQELSKSTVKDLYLNAHTIKGEARTLGLSFIADCIHDIESQYSQFLAGDSELADHTLFSKDISSLGDMFRLYERTNKDTLNRDSSSSDIKLDKGFIRKHLRLLKRLENYDGQSRDDENLFEQLNMQTKELTQLSFPSYQSVFREYFSKASSVAKHLGKEEPIIDMQIDEVPIHQEIEQVLRRILTHLLRNSLDHGIETGAERVAQGKPKQGTIRITNVMDRDRICIMISDDGKGLALGMLKQKGKDLNILDDNATPEDIADLIFYESVSTAQSVSQISGRGVGMSAVKKYIRGVGGDISIHFDQNRIDTDGYASFAFHISFPLADDLKLLAS